MMLTSLLTVVFIFMAVYSAIFVRRALIRYFILFAYLSAIFFVWNPNETTIIANYFGIGRGLDFILILFSVAIINGTFFIIEHLNSQHQSITRMARYMAIQEAQSPLISGDARSVDIK